jgi:hypothetical protein
MEKKVDTGEVDARNKKGKETDVGKIFVTLKYFHVIIIPQTVILKHNY